MLTRIFDIIISLIGLFLLLLLLPWLALLIKLDSKGSIFYKCDRVGLNGKIFKMYKFRTMNETPLGPNVSVQGDPRVTRVGRVLRRLKLNELPQFINTLKGEMTLVGPRPEGTDLAAAYPEWAKKIFTVKPGLVGPNQIQGRNEEELYPPGVDPVDYYINHILPNKLVLDLQFIEDKSFWKNLKYLLLGIKVTVIGAISRRHLMDNRSQLFMLLCDTSLCMFSFTLAHVVRYGLGNTLQWLPAFLEILPWAILIRILLFNYLGFYHILIRYLSLYDMIRVFKGVAWGSITLLCFSFLSRGGMRQEVLFIDWTCLTTFLIGYRVLLIILYRHLKGAGASRANKRRVLIWGAGDAGEICLRLLRKEKEPAFEVVGYIDDNPMKWGKTIEGVKVLGDRRHLDILSKLYRVQDLFVAIPSASLNESKRILQMCCGLGIVVKFFSAKDAISNELLTMGLQYTQVNGYSPYIVATRE